jgi:hypothetical protein
MFLLSLTLHFITINQNSLIDSCINLYSALSKKDKSKIVIIYTTKLSQKQYTNIKKFQLKIDNSQFF